MHYSDPEFRALNATYLDALIQHWEKLMEASITIRFGEVTDEQVQELLEQARVNHTNWKRERALFKARARGNSWGFPLEDLIDAYELDSTETSILELALMPHLDINFRRRLQRYHNNILYNFVDVDLILCLLFKERSERLQARSYFASDSKLIANGLITLENPRESRGDSLLGQEIRIAERLADFVICRRSIDVMLKGFAELHDPKILMADVAFPEADRTELRAILKSFVSSNKLNHAYARGPFGVGKGLAVALVGPPGTGKSILAESIAHELQRPLILVDSATLAGDSRPFVTLIRELFTEARVQGAVLIFDRCETLMGEKNPRLPPLISQLERHPGITIFTTNRPDEVDSSVEHYVGYQVVLGMPDMDQRTRIWSMHLPDTVAIHPDVDLEDLGTRFELTGGQIASACELAEQRVTGDEAIHAVSQDLLRECAQAQIRANMEDLSVKSRVTLTLDDLILPERELSMVKEVLMACRNRVFVMTKWGFGRRLVTGKGIVVLFKGDPGTGKTLCAEILASELGMKLYQVSIPRLVSKYVGETEKNISKIFASARANHSMLLFDEADSLFGKRITNVESSVDRFSNMETNLLLQEIERFEGVVLMTTNLDKNIDDAFARRIMFKITFPKPDVEHRALIWKKLIPKDCPVDDDIDYDALAESFELAGGNIKNAVVRAAYRAAERRDKITWEDIEMAAEKECMNAGKLFRSSSRSRDWV